jgi:hypothetical protein
MNMEKELGNNREESKEIEKQNPWYEYNNIANNNEKLLNETIITLRLKKTLQNSLYSCSYAWP